MTDKAKEALFANESVPDKALLAASAFGTDLNRKRGRPLPLVPSKPLATKKPKKETVKVKKGVTAQARKSGLKPGRPPASKTYTPNDPKRLQELKNHLMGTKGELIIKAIINKALDPEDQDQIACMKMCIDRILPISMFEKGAGKSNAVTIQIVNTGESKTRIIGSEAEGNDEDDEDTIEMETTPTASTEATVEVLPSPEGEQV